MIASRTVVMLLAVVVCMSVVAESHTIDIVAAGASFPERLYDALSFAFAAELTGYSLTYTSLGSGKGKCRVLNHTTSCQPGDDDFPRELDWAGTDSTHASQDYANFTDLQMFPAIAGAVVAAYNVEGVDDLVLPKEVLANIFRKCAPAGSCPPGWITYWNDSAILNANPTIPIDLLTAAGEIKVVVRADSSGTTEIFRQSLKEFSPEFAAQMGPNNLKDGTTWPGCSHLTGNTNRGVTSVIISTPSSIGYVSLDEATSSGLRIAGMGRSVLNSDSVLRATPRSVEYALLERGFSFGNNGEPASRLTASVMGATGSEAWPMVGYTYFSVRLNANGVSSCNRRRAVLHWFEWFYSSPTVEDIALNQGFAPIPDEGRRFILDRLRSSFRCNGALVFDDPANFPVARSSEERIVPVIVRTVPEIASVVALYRDAYRYGKTGFARINVLPTNGSGISRKMEVEVLVVDHQSLTAAQTLSEHLILPFAGIPWGLTYTFCDVTLSSSCALSSLDVILTPQLAADILSGRIVYWNDSRVQEVQEGPAQAAMLPFLPVRVVTYLPHVRELKLFQTLAKERELDLDMSQVIPAAVAASAEEAVRLVASMPGAVTFGPINRNSDVTLTRVARMKSSTESSVILTGSAESVKPCIMENAQAKLQRFNLTHAYADQSTCWPLSNAYFVVLSDAFTNEECISRLAQEATHFAAFLLRVFNGTVLDPLSLVGMASLDVDSSDELSSLTCFGRSILKAEIDMQLVPEGLIWTVRAMGITLIGFVLLLAGWIYRNRFQPVMRASSPIFMWQMCFGFLLEVSAIFPLTIQEGPGITQEHLDIACMAAPWLYVMGFAFVYGSLLVKTWRIYKIFHNPAMRRMYITALDLAKLEIVFVIPLIIVLVMWTTLDPFVWRRSVSNVDPTTGEVISTKGECVSNNLLHFLVPIIGILGSYIVAGLALAWKNRNTPTEFSEGRYVSGAIMTDTELLIIAVPVLVIASSNPIASFVVKVTFILLSVSATILVFFYPKLAILKGFWVMESASSSYLGAKGKRLPKGSNEDAKVNDNSMDESAANQMGFSRWSTRRPSNMGFAGKYFRSGSIDGDFKGFASYAKPSSWYGKSSNQDDKSNATQRRETMSYVDYADPSPPITPQNATSSGASNDNVPGEDREGESGTGGSAAMFFGLRVVS